jgi:catechol 2,3-dioxygenase-like lactoylglutathione lyase family enzyme
LVTVEDARLPAVAGLETRLDAFYVGLLQFERDLKTDGLVYKAENFRLRFDVVEVAIPRDDMRMLGVIVKSLADMMRRLGDAEIAYSRERGLNAGEERLLLLDPAGNWIRIVQSKAIM